MKDAILAELNRRLLVLGEQYEPNMYSTAHEWQVYALQKELRSLIGFVEGLADPQ